MFRKPRRRLRVLLHRYPLLPFLMAATIVVDLSLFSIYSSNPQGVLQKFFIGTTVSQFCLIGIWIVHRLSGMATRLGVAVISLALFVFLFSAIDETARKDMAAVAAIGSITSALCYVAIYLIRNLRDAQKQFVSISFSIRELLVLSTSVALMFYGLRIVELNQLQDNLLIVICFSLLTVLIWKSCDLKSVVLRVVSHFLCFGILCFALHLYIASSSFSFSDLLDLRITSFSYLVLRSIVEHSSLCGGATFFTLIWSYGLQFRRRPIRYRKIEKQAVANALEQPTELRVIHQEEDHEEEDPQDPPGPIDVTI